MKFWGQIRKARIKRTFLEKNHNIGTNEPYGFKSVKESC